MLMLSRYTFWKWLAINQIDTIWQSMYSESNLVRFLNTDIWQLSLPHLITGTCNLHGFTVEIWGEQEFSLWRVKFENIKSEEYVICPKKNIDVHILLIIIQEKKNKDIKSVGKDNKIWVKGISLPGTEWMLYS